MVFERELAVPVAWAPSRIVRRGRGNRRYIDEGLTMSVDEIWDVLGQSLIELKLQPEERPAGEGGMGQLRVQTAVYSLA